MQVQAYGVSDVGCVRSNNEDAFLIRPDLSLYVVADGVGGAAAGEVASRIFVESCEQEFANYNGWSEDYSPLISRCFINANQNILDHSKQQPDTKGMGCTAELLTFVNNEYFIGHVGDSRTYLLRDKVLTQVTKDHSYIQEQIDLGLIKKEETANHWLKNAIYRAVGHIDEVEIDIHHGRIRTGDCFLLCSDGLTDMVEDEDIAKVLNLPLALDQRAQELINLAKEYGGKDNITVLLCEVDNVEGKGQQVLSQIKNRFLGR